MILNTENTRLAQDKAVYAHQGQFRKGDKRIPYHMHTFAVAEYVSRMRGDEKTVIAAFLHDTQEDARERYPRDQMVADFGELGEPVAQIVDAVTKDDTIEDWAELKTAQLAHLKGLVEFPEAMAVLLGDKTHNVESTLRGFREFGEKFWEPFGGGMRGQIEWFKLLRDEVFIESQMPPSTVPFVREFGQKVLQLEQMGGVSLDQRRAS